MANATSIGKAIFQEEGNKTSSQVFRNLNGDASDANMAAYMAAACGLTTKTVNAYQRTDTKEITL